jgi:hypothetical protein
MRDFLFASKAFPHPELVEGRTAAMQAFRVASADDLAAPSPIR